MGKEDVGMLGYPEVKGVDEVFDSGFGERLEG